MCWERAGATSVDHLFKLIQREAVALLCEDRPRAKEGCNYNLCLPLKHCQQRMSNNYHRLDVVAHQQRPALLLELRGDQR